MRYSSILSSLLFLFASFVVSDTRGADIAVSSFEKLSSTLPFMKVLGKNDMGILVYRYGKKMNLMYAYNNDLTLKWRKSITPANKNSEVISHILLPDGLIMVSIIREANSSKIYLQKLVEDLRKSSPSVLLDSIEDYRGENIRVESAPKNGHHAIYYFSRLKGKQPIMNLLIINSKMELISKQKIKLPFGEDDETHLSQILLAPNNQCYLAINNRVDKKKSANKHKFHLFKLDYKTENLVQFEIAQDSITLEDIILKYDQTNQKLLICGLYKKKGIKGISGVLSMKYFPENNSPEPAVYIPFSDSLIQMMNGTKRSNNDDGLLSFHTRDIIVREDGGLILLTESYFTTSETRSSSGYYPSMFYSSITYNYYHYNDILLVSIHPDQKIHWFKQVMKNQVSEGDDGLYASYNLSYTRANMHILFNDDVLQNGSVTQIKVDGKGRSQRSTVLGNSRNDLMLIFRMAKQISHDELIVPSIFRNKLKIVKITL